MKDDNFDPFAEQDPPSFPIMNLVAEGLLECGRLLVPYRVTMYTQDGDGLHIHIGREYLRKEFANISITVDANGDVALSVRGVRMEERKDISLGNIFK
jgi:hypothetical protein